MSQLRWLYFEAPAGTTVNFSVSVTYNTSNPGTIESGFGPRCIYVAWTGTTSSPFPSNTVFGDGDNFTQLLDEDGYTFTDSGTLELTEATRININLQIFIIDTTYTLGSAVDFSMEGILTATATGQDGLEINLASATINLGVDDGGVSSNYITEFGTVFRTFTA